MHTINYVIINNNLSLCIHFSLRMAIYRRNVRRFKFTCKLYYCVLTLVYVNYIISLVLCLHLPPLFQVFRNEDTQGYELLVGEGYEVNAEWREANVHLSVVFRTYPVVAFSAKINVNCIYSSSRTSRRTGCISTIKIRWSCLGN
jgi:hypothetical protein